MSYLIDDLKNMNAVVQSKDDGWVLSRPIPGPFICRLKDAWMVLIGEYDAVRWNVVNR